MMNSDNAPRKLPRGLKIAAIFFVFEGIYQIVAAPVGQAIDWPVTARIPLYATGSALGVAFVVAGIGVLRRSPWARNMAVVALLLSSPYSVNDAAWAWASPGVPDTSSPWVVGLIITITIDGALFYLICRKSSAQALCPRSASLDNRASGEENAAQ
jgi:hypothetical protein